MKTTFFVGFRFVVLLGVWLSVSRVSAVPEFELTDLGINRGRLSFTFIQGGKRRDIYLLDLKNKTIEVLVASPEVDEYAAWSPDGSRLVFHSDMSGDRELYLVNSDGSNLRQLTKSPGRDQYPDWSPDGKKIVFSSMRSGSGQDLYIIGANGKDVKRLTVDGKTNILPKWSPGGGEILYSTSRKFPGVHLAIHDLTTGRDTALTGGDRSYYRRAAWAPDGSKFAFCYESGGDSDIFVRARSDKFHKLDNRSRLAADPAREYDPVWSGDGTMIFYVKESVRGKKDYQLYVYFLEKKESKLLLSGPGAIRHPSWTPHQAPKLQPEDHQTPETVVTPDGTAAAHFLSPKPVLLEREPKPKPRSSELHPPVTADL